MEVFKMPVKVPYDHFKPTYNTQQRECQADALSFCLASRLAYEDAHTISSQAEKWKFDETRCFSVTRGHDIDTQGYVAVNEEHLLVAFRGTDSLPDWLCNLQVVKSPGPWRDTEVHGGFQDAFMAAALQIGKIIGEIRKQHNVWLTGHSLGGALAVLLAATMRECKLPVHGLYTFGAPRVGNKSFGRS